MRDSDWRSEFPAVNSHGHRGDKPRSQKAKWWARACVAFMFCAAAAVSLPAQTFTTMLSFDSMDGAQPQAGLVQGTDGNLYGTTSNDGANGQGTAFRVTLRGGLTTLYSFCSQGGCTDGERPYAGLVQGAYGNLYGTTLTGRIADCYGSGCGTVFEITPSGMLTTLHSFDSADGADPEAALIEATNGNLYGTTSSGGAHAVGTVFKITPIGKLTTLYNFCSQTGCTDGAQPLAGLIQAIDGNFYGTTSNIFTEGHGTVFKITRGGTLTTLYSFCSQSGCADGANPYAGLVQATDGNLYGTTAYGGAYGYGTVFKITLSGVLTTLYSFCSRSGCTDGIEPEAGLIQGTNGRLYGTTEYGGANGTGGTVFEITPAGTLTTLYSFCSQNLCTDGGEPAGALAQDTNGRFYGTTYSGGARGYGTVFSLSVGLGPFVEAQPIAAPVGKPINILGSSLKGATSVTFNGTAAAFTVESSSLIKATVPTGATTGTVQVVTPGGTLSSNVPFRVIQ